MSEPSVSDQCEALRSALGLVKLSAANDPQGMAQLVSTMGEFEIGTAIGALTQFAVTGVAALAGGAGILFSEMLTRLEHDLIISVMDGG